MLLAIIISSGGSVHTFKGEAVLEIKIMHILNPKSDENKQHNVLLKTILLAPVARTYFIKNC